MSVEPEITAHRLSPELPEDYLDFFDGPTFADDPDRLPQRLRALRRLGRVADLPGGIMLTRTGL